MLEIDFSQYSSVKIGAKMRLQLLKECKDYGGVQMVGLGNNLLVSPQACNLAMLDRCFDYIDDRGSFIEVGAKTSAQKLFSYFKAHNLGGLEFFKRIARECGWVA
ncbi:UDP-N-acetylenolpyruvoylglucosamine reductase [Helicobacter bizzozeronii CCUG 35545]|nr:UDP-N-acetylenolpyruvoylglucosamine reductase [Helicobacter bizzozeronii CCUG 35545]